LVGVRAGKRLGGFIQSLKVAREAQSEMKEMLSQTLIFDISQLHSRAMLTDTHPMMSTASFWRLHET
jgi:hypothetical protein